MNEKIELTNIKSNNYYLRFLILQQVLSEFNLVAQNIADTEERQNLQNKF